MCVCIAAFRRFTIFQCHFIHFEPSLSSRWTNWRTRAKPLEHQFAKKKKKKCFPHMPGPSVTQSRSDERCIDRASAFNHSTTRADVFPIVSYPDSQTLPYYLSLTLPYPSSRYPAHFTLHFSALSYPALRHLTTSHRTPTLPSPNQPTHLYGLHYTILTTYLVNHILAFWSSKLFGYNRNFFHTQI